MKKAILLFMAVTVALLTMAQSPTITSFSPDSGPVGTTVTITGTNFSPVAENNTVYIGGVKATVTAATTTSLTVIAPAGALQQPLSVTVNGSTAYATKPFVVTTPCPNPTLSFVRTNSTVPVSPFADIDGDGKVDFRVSKADSLSILRNLSVGDSLAFAPAVSLPTGTGSDVRINDWDGDGKLDVVVINSASNTFSVFRNTSSIGTISFAPKVDLPFTGSPSIIDWDGDGKLDVAVVNSVSNTFSVVRNTSSTGIISFAPRLDASVPGIGSLSIRDLNGDGKPDLYSFQDLGPRGTLSVYLNISTEGTLAFANKVDFPIQVHSGQYHIADFDGDGKPDFIFLDFAYYYFLVLRNTSTGGSLSFEGGEAVNYPVAYPTRSFKITDLDRDGKLDLLTYGGMNQNYYSTVLRNTSTPGTISFAGAQYDGVPRIGIYASEPMITDLTGDGKPELIVQSVTGDQCSKDSTLVSILQNTSTAGSLSFRYAQTFSFGGCYVSIGIVDYNGDGKSELYISGFVYRNEMVCSPCAPAELPTFKNNGTIALNPTCGNSDGTLSIISTSGTAPYLYSKDGGATYVSGSDAGYTFNNLAIGTYKLRLKDARGCESAIIVKTLTSSNCPATICNDPTFNSGTGANGDIRTTAIQSDGKILIGGAFTSYNGTGRNYIARLNNDGSLDASFNPGTGADGIIYTTAIQRDGKIIIGGAFTLYNGTVRNKIARLNPDGSLDAGFNPGSGANNQFIGPPSILTTAIQSDGKIIIGGAFTSYDSYDGTARNYIARLNPDGILDASFNPGTGANNIIQTTAIQSDGKILIGGWFTAYDGTVVNRLARLNTDGSLDASFDPGTGADGTIYTTALQSDGKIVVGGAFTSFNETGRNRVARLMNCATTCTPPTFLNDGTIVANATCGKSDGALYVVPTSGTAPFMYSKDGGATYVAGSNTGYSFEGLVAGTYKLRLKDAGGCESVVVEKTIGSDCPTTCTPPTFLNNGMIVQQATCGKSDGALYLIPTSGTAPFMYSKDGGTTYVSGPASGYTFSGLSAGTYQLRLKDASGCESVAVAREVKALDCPTTCTAPTLLNNGMIVGHATCGMNDGSLYLIPTSGTAPYQYSINGGQTYVSGPDAGYTFQNLAAGSYQLRIKDASGCESAVVEKEVLALYGTCAGAASKKSTVTDVAAGTQTSVLVYPNPSKGMFRLQLKGTTGKVQIQVLNSNGQVIEQRRVNVSEAGTLDFNLSSKAKGLYLIKVVSPKGIQQTKVMIQ